MCIKSPFLLSHFSLQTWYPAWEMFLFDHLSMVSLNSVFFSISLKQNYFVVLYIHASPESHIFSVPSRLLCLLTCILVTIVESNLKTFHICFDPFYDFRKNIIYTGSEVWFHFNFSSSDIFPLFRFISNSIIFQECLDYKINFDIKIIFKFIPS